MGKCVFIDRHGESTYSVEENDRERKLLTLLQVTVSLKSNFASIKTLLLTLEGQMLFYG